MIALAFIAGFLLAGICCLAWAWLAMREQ